MELFSLTDQCNISFFNHSPRETSVLIQNVYTNYNGRKVVDESKLFTAVLLQPVNILLFSLKSIGSTHTTEEPSACVETMSEFRGSCVI